LGRRHRRGTAIAIRAQNAAIAATGRGEVCTTKELIRRDAEGVGVEIVLINSKAVGSRAELVCRIIEIGCDLILNRWRRHLGLSAGAGRDRSSGSVNATRLAWSDGALAGAGGALADASRALSGSRTSARAGTASAALSACAKAQKSGQRGCE